jgi:glutamate/aspartate transport system substrate-binding protein
LSRELVAVFLLEQKCAADWLFAGLCREIVEEASTELASTDIKVTLSPVTSADRLVRVKAGEIDLECNSTTSTPERRGTKLMVPKASKVTSYRDLAGKTVVVTAGTTNEAALRTISDKQRLGINVVTERDHAESFGVLESGKADAFATDDVLLYASSRRSRGLVT